MARALLRTARQWVFERGAKFLRGPVNPSTNYECGMLVDGFDSQPDGDDDVQPAVLSRR